MLTVACCLWLPNELSESFSRCYDESWVNKLYRGFARNLSNPFRFVCFTDRRRIFCDRVEQQRLQTVVPHYGCLIEPFRLNTATIICGLDTVVLGNLDHMADYCLTATKIAAVRDPYKLDQSINPIVLVPKGWGRVFDVWRGQNDMEYIRRWPVEFIDDLWPGQVISYKAHGVRDKGIQGARVVYFHGKPKMQKLSHDWVREHWR